MEGAQHRAWHAAGAPDLFICTLWPLTSQRHRWPMTTSGAAAVSGKAQGALGCLGRGSSSGCKDQGGLPRGRGLGRGRRSSAAARSRPAHPSELLESSLPLSPKDQSQVFLSHWTFYPELDRAGGRGRLERNWMQACPESDNLVGERGHSVRSRHLHQNGALQFLLSSSPDCRETPAPAPEASVPRGGQLFTSAALSLPCSLCLCLLPLWPPETWQGRDSEPSALGPRPGHPRHCHLVPEVSSVACQEKSPIWLTALRKLPHSACTRD